MIKRYWVACIVGLLLVLSLVGPALAGDPEWPGSGALVLLSANAQRPDMSLSDLAVAAVWSGTSPKGIYLRQRALIAETWGTPQTVASGGQDYWQPQVAYAGATPVAVWLQGAYTDPFTATVMVRDMTSTPLAPVAAISDLYVFDSAVRMEISAANVRHLIVGGNRNSEVNLRTSNDLYYTFKRPGDVTWAATQVVITRTQVVTPTVGSIKWVDMALSADGDTVHVVWEQHASIQGPGAMRTIWYLRGTWNGNGVTWGTPQRLSTADRFSVRPSIAVDDTNTAHVVWGQVSYLAAPGLGYIRYRQVTPGGGLSAEGYVDDRPVQINAQLPTMTYPVIATGGETVCVAWHGYRLEANAAEEIYLRCATERGQVWNTPVFNAANTSAELSIFPQVACATNGTVHLVWEELVLGTKQEVVYRAGRAVLHSIMLPLVMRGYP